MYNLEAKPSIRRSPLWNTSTDLDQELERFFDVFSKADNFAPAFEILDEDKSYIVGLDVPGLKKDDIDIEVKDNHLIVTGERKSDKHNVNVLRSERRYGRFSRVFGLPQNLDTESIDARYENGVLSIHLPKEEKSQPRKIKISNWKEKDVQSELKS